MSVTRLPLYLLTVSAIALAATASAGPIYKWVDDKGVTHYGEKAPDGAQTSKVKVSDTTSSDAEDEIADLNKRRNEQEEARKKTEENKAGQIAAGSDNSAADQTAACEAHRKNLAALRSGKRARIMGDDGKPRILDDAAMAEQVKFAESELQRCEQVKALRDSANKAPAAPAR